MADSRDNLPDQVTMAMVNHYLTTTGIEDVFKDLCHNLLKSPRLPYNPYPGLVRQLRAYAESFTYHSVDDEDVYQQLIGKVKKTTISEIVQPINGDPIFGTANSVEMIKPSVLNKYRWLLKNVTPHVSRLHQESGYVNQVVTALLAPATLHGTFYPDPPAVNFRVEFIIIGSDVNKAVHIFLQSVTNDIIHMESAGQHIFLGLTVPMRDKSDETKWQLRIFSVEMLQNKKSETWEAIYEAMVAHKKISAECLFRLSDGGDTYKPGQKEYHLNFVEIEEATGSEKGFRFFSEFPFATLYEGIFLQQSYAEAYVNTFLRRLNFFDDADDASSRHQPRDGSTASLRRPTHLMPFLGNCQRLIASFHSPSQIFDIVRYALILVTADRNSYPISLSVDLYKVLRSTAAQLHNLMQQNRTMQMMVQHLLGLRKHSSVVVNKLFKLSRDSTKELFSREDTSCDLKAVGQVVMRSLAEITDGDIPDVPINADTLSELNYINVYCKGLFYQLAEDVLETLPELSHFIKTMQEAFPDAAQFTPTQIESTLQLHGMEELKLLMHDNEVLNVQSCMRQVDGPQQITKEAVLLTYVVDTHLDDVWSEFLVDLLTGEISNLPKNPFPHLVSALRQATLSMELCAETDDQLQQRILHGNVQEDDAQHYICTIPDHKVYGVSSALTALDVTAFDKFMELVHDFLRDEPSHKEDMYEVSMSCAVSGHCTLYGAVDPYMRQIELHEHCYIKGPTGCVGEALPIYAQLVYEELMTASRCRDYVILGVFMGREENLWRIASVRKRKKGFMAELEHRFVAKDPIYWKIFVWRQWRYVPVVKYLQLHYWNTELTEHQIFFPENTANLYQYVFPSREKMSLHMKYGGLPHNGDPYSQRSLEQASVQVNQGAVEAKKRFDWLNVHRWLLTGHLMYNDESFMSEVWRSLHSPAAQLEYIISVGRSLSEIVHCGIELKDAIKKRNTEISPLQREDRTRDELRMQINVLTCNVPAMLSGYWDKLLQVSIESSSLAPLCLPQLLHQKLRSVTVANRDSDRRLLQMGEETQHVLNEIGIVLSYVQDAIGHDIHNHSPRAAAMLETIEAKLGNRPQSVASVQLRDMSLQ